MFHYNSQDRRQATEWARNLLALDDFYILDTETTGVGAMDEIIQIGLIDKYGETVMETLVQPSIPVPAEAIRVHGITDSRLMDAPGFLDIYGEFADLLKGRVIVAYNVDFDWRLIRQTASLYQVPLPETGMRHCAMKWYARFHGVWNGRRRQYRWHRLADACGHQNILVENAHSAVGDCLMTLELIRKMAE